MDISTEKRVEDGILEKKIERILADSIPSSGITSTGTPFNSLNEQVTFDTLFETMIQAHYQNLQACLPHLKEGQMVDTEGKPIGEEGEIPYYKGLLLAFDGATILERAATRFVRGGAIRETEYTPNANVFIRQLNAKQDPDGVYVYNTINGQLTRIKGELSNKLDGDLDELLTRNLPPTFLSADGSKPVTDVGTKTGIAVLTAYALNNDKEKGYFAGLVGKAISKLKGLVYHTEDHAEDKKQGGVRTLIVKRTPYNGLLGIVAEFGRDGLTKGFYFDFANGNDRNNGLLIDDERGIIGVYKEYGRNSEGKLVCTAEKRVYAQDGKLYWSTGAFEPNLEQSRAGLSPVCPENYLKPYPGRTTPGWSIN